MDETLAFSCLRTGRLVENTSLPIHRHRQEILYLIERHSVVILVGSAGSGKSTQLPKFLLEQGWSGIACSQPRRLAAVTLAQRVSREMGENDVGRTVGYCIRLENCISERTRCRFISDGMLLRECLHDPLLSRYSVIIVDEAHERTLHTDILLALLKKIIPKRPDLRVIISSATLDARGFQRYFTLPQRDLITGKRIYGPTLPADLKSVEIQTIEDTPPQSQGSSDCQSAKPPLPVYPCDPAIVSIEGRHFPVQIEFLLKSPSTGVMFSESIEIILDAISRLVCNINQTEGVGDILVFLAGRGEIEQCHGKLALGERASFKEADDDELESSLKLFKRPKKSTTKSTAPRLDILQLYAGLDVNDQMKIFEPARPGHRKVILSTNVAEASLTIDGIGFVIDSGRMKMKVWNGTGRRGEQLEILPISQASADQRAGRAGRTCPGKTFRLYSRDFFETSMLKHSIPAIQLCDLTQMLLQLKVMGIASVEGFDFLQPPPPQNLHSALQELQRLGATNTSGTLTEPFGRRLAQLPLHPAIGKLFLCSAIDLGCPREGAALAAILSVSESVGGSGGNGLSTFVLPSCPPKHQRKFWVEEGDHMSLLSLFMSFLASHPTNSVKFCQKYHLNLKSLTSAHRLYQLLLAYLGKVFKLPTNRSHAMGIEGITAELRKALIQAFPFNVAQANEVQANYSALIPSEDANDAPLSLNIHPNSVLFKRLPPLVLYSQMIHTTKPFISLVSVIEPEWLAELLPEYYALRKKHS